MMVFLNGRMIPESQAHISIHDHGFLYGDGVYETLRVRESVPLFLEEHMNRLKHSLKALSMASPLTSKALSRAIHKLILVNRHKESALRLTITRGVGGHGFDPSLCKTPTILMTSRPFTGYPARFYKRGMIAALVSIQRNAPEALPPSVKSISCLNNILAKIESRKVKADEALMLSAGGSVAEGTVSNVFFVKQEQLFTPALDGHQLSGVTRACVCELARKEGFRVTETKVSVEDLMSADEVFLTSSLMEIMPVGKLVVDGKVHFVGTTMNWPITRRLMICYTSLRRKSNRFRGSI